MSSPKNFVITHKMNFDLYDCSESMFDHSEKIYEHS